MLPRLAGDLRVQLKYIPNVFEFALVGKNNIDTVSTGPRVTLICYLSVHREDIPFLAIQVLDDAKLQLLPTAIGLQNV